MSESMLSEWVNAQKPKGSSMKDASVFYRNLEEALDVKRKDHGLYTLKRNTWQSGASVDFSSNDTLSIGASGALRREFMKELERFPDAAPGAGSSRVMDGNSEYLEMVEDEIARFHGAEAGLLTGSGFDANMAIFAALPRPGDVVLYDELVHASTHDGMLHSQVSHKVPFQHNDLEAFREALIEIQNSQPLIKQAKRCIIVAVESFYSMDGDICPLKELIEIAKQVFPRGNVQFLVDEAHSTGVIGHNGSGLVCELGLEKEIAIRLHTFGKALSGCGAIILGSPTIKSALVNLARPVIFTTAPSFANVAAARAAYNLLQSGETQAAQQKIQTLVHHFFNLLTSNDIFDEAEDLGILNVPLATTDNDNPNSSNNSDFDSDNDTDDASTTSKSNTSSTSTTQNPSNKGMKPTFKTHIVPIWTQPKHAHYLSFHLHLANICTFPIDYPTVPKGQSRVRISFHANNTLEQVEKLVHEICTWAKEMIDIEKENKKTKMMRAGGAGMRMRMMAIRGKPGTGTGVTGEMENGSGGARLPKAARIVYGMIDE